MSVEPIQKQVTGFEIYEAMKQAELERDFAYQRFTDSIWAFEDEKKDKPAELAVAYKQADEKVAKLQALQERFNQETKVALDGQCISLALAIKLIGGAERLKNVWRGVSNDSRSDYFGRRDRTRNKEQEYAAKQVDTAVAMEKTAQAAKLARNLRAAVAKGNAQSLWIGSEEKAAGAGTCCKVDPDLIGEIG